MCVFVFLISFLGGGFFCRMSLKVVDRDFSPTLFWASCDDSSSVSLEKKRQTISMWPKERREWMCAFALGGFFLCIQKPPPPPSSWPWLRPWAWAWAWSPRRGGVSEWRMGFIFLYVQQNRSRIWGDVNRCVRFFSPGTSCPMLLFWSSFRETNRIGRSQNEREKVRESQKGRGAGGERSEYAQWTEGEYFEEQRQSRRSLFVYTGLTLPAPSKVF